MEAQNLNLRSKTALAAAVAAAAAAAGTGNPLEPMAGGGSVCRIRLKLIQNFVLENANDAAAAYAKSVYSARVCTRVTSRW